MELKAKAAILKRTLQNSYDLLEKPKYEIIESEDHIGLTLLLYFDPLKCVLIKNKKAFNNKVRVGMKIVEFPILGTNLPVLQLSTYFPYPFEMSSSYAQFLLGYLADAPHYPFIEINLYKKNIDSKEITLLDICCSRHLASGEPDPAEILMYMTTLLAYCEEMVVYYQSVLSNH